jgi:hypothetical protein
MFLKIRTKRDVLKEKPSEGKIEAICLNKRKHPDAVTKKNKIYCTDFGEKI